MRDPYRVILNVKNNPWIPAFENYITQIENTIAAESVEEKLRLMKLIQHIDMLIDSQQGVVGLIESTLQGANINDYLAACAKARDGDETYIAKIGVTRRQYADQLTRLTKKQRADAQLAAKKIIPASQQYAKNVKAVSRKVAKELEALRRVSPNVPIQSYISTLRAHIETEYSKVDAQKKQLDSIFNLLRAQSEYTTGIEQLRQIGEKLIALDKENKVRFVISSSGEILSVQFLPPPINGEQKSTQELENLQRDAEFIRQQLNSIISSTGKHYKYVDELRKKADGEAIQGAKEKEQYLLALERVQNYLLAGASVSGKKHKPLVKTGGQVVTNLSHTINKVVENSPATAENITVEIGVSTLLGKQPRTQEEREDLETYSTTGYFQESVKMVGMNAMEDQQYLYKQISRKKVKDKVGKSCGSALNNNKRNVEIIPLQSMTMKIMNDLVLKKEKSGGKMNDQEVADFSDDPQIKQMIDKANRQAQRDHDKGTAEWKTIYSYIQKEADKVDEFTKKVYKNADGEKVEFYLAFSDKLYSSDYAKKVQITSGSLMSNKDLFLNDTAGAGDLVFYMLNQATASAFAGHGNFDEKQMEQLVNTLVMGNIAEQMFDTRAFQKMEKNRNKNNVLYILNVNNMYIPLLTILKEIRDKLENGLSDPEQIVSTNFTFDTSTDASSILTIARAQYGYDQDTNGVLHDSQESWAYVASQVAARTKINVRFHPSYFSGLMINT